MADFFKFFQSLTPCTELLNSVQFYDILGYTLSLFEKNYKIDSTLNVCALNMALQLAAGQLNLALLIIVWSSDIIGNIPFSLCDMNQMRRSIADCTLTAVCRQSQQLMLAILFEQLKVEMASLGGYAGQEIIWHVHL